MRTTQDTNFYNNIVYPVLNYKSICKDYDKRINKIARKSFGKKFNNDLETMHNLYLEKAKFLYSIAQIKQNLIKLNKYDLQLIYKHYFKNKTIEQLAKEYNTSERTMFRHLAEARNKYYHIKEKLC